MTRAPRPAKAIEPPPRPHYGWLAALGALLLCVLFAPWLVARLGRGPAGDSQVHYASGYTQIVDELIAPMGWLVYHDGGDGDEVSRVVTLSDDAYRQGAVRDFYRNSFLRGDILADDPKRWRFNGRAVVGVEPTAHTQAGPFEAVRLWRGDITYRDASDTPHPTLAWAGDSLALAEQQDAVDWSALPAFGPKGLVEAQTEAAAGLRFVDEKGQNLSAAVVIGERLLLRVLPRTSAEVLVDGVGLTAPDDGTAYATLGRGDELSFRRNGLPFGQTIRIGLASSAISRFRPFTQRERGLGAQTLAIGLETALDHVTDQGRKSGLTAPASLSTTLDHDAQDTLQSLLTKTSDEVREQTQGRDFPAAATVMDATSGEILALASYPERTVNPDAPAPNYNFRLLPIGSIAKVPFSAAILSAQPRLKALVIQGAQGQPFRTLFGIDLKREFPEEAMAAQVDFKTFLVHSSNKYATSLLLLASARDPLAADGPSTPEPYDLEHPRDHLPRLPFRELTDQRTQYGVPVQGLAGPLSAFVAPDGGRTWISILSQAFDLPGAEKLAGETDFYDFGPWSGATSGWDDLSVRALADVSPERESFGLNAIGDLRDDYLSLILGGGRSRWSTLKVAEVFSRLVTDRSIHARLVMLQTPAAPEPLAGIDPNARTAILDALSEVPKSGTAGSLAPWLAPLKARAMAGAEEIRVFAKTGTPRLQKPYRSPVNRAIDTLIRLRFLTLEGGKLRLAVGGEDKNLQAALSGDRRIRQELQDLGVGPGEVAAGVRDLNARLHSRDGAALLSYDRDRLEGLAPDRNTQPYSGGALALVVGLYRPQCRDDQPVRALTVVINIQDKADGDHVANPAIAVAGRFLDSRAFQTLLFAPAAASGCGR